MGCNRAERSHRKPREPGEEVEIGIALLILVRTWHYVVDTDNLSVNHQEPLRRSELTLLKLETVSSKEHCSVLLFGLLHMNV